MHLSNLSLVERTVKISGQKSEALHLCHSPRYVHLLHVPDTESADRLLNGFDE